MAKDRFSIRVQLVFRIIDSLTFAPVKKEYLRFSCQGQGKILPKEDGFFVVIGNEKPSSLWVESPIYASISINREEMNEEGTMVLWAIPIRGYHLVPNLQWLNLSCEPGKRVFALAKDKEPTIRLLEDAPEGAACLQIYQERTGQLDGAPVVLMEKGKGEDFSLVFVANVEKAVCHLQSPLPKGYKKIKTGLYPLLQGRAKETCLCEIAVPNEDAQGQYVFLDEMGVPLAAEEV